MSSTIDAAGPRTAGATATPKPGLVFVLSSRDGYCRRVEAFLAQVLQRRRNHDTFRLIRVDSVHRPDVVERLGVTTIPSLLVVEDKRVQARLEHPRGCKDIEEFLTPWLSH